MTGFEISELVTDAPRGEVIKTKIEKYFPDASKIPGSGYILKLLPSKKIFTGNIYFVDILWELYIVISGKTEKEKMNIFHCLRQIKRCIKMQ